MLVLDSAQELISFLNKVKKGGEPVKNTECTIYIMSKHGWIQKFKKEKDGWTLTTRKGTVYPCTAEQLLSHLLPALAGIKGPSCNVKVEPDNRNEI